jgi:hypothetical protein
MGFGYGISQSRHSLRIVPIMRSHMAFIFGLCGADFNTLIPRAQRKHYCARWAQVM